MGKLRGICFILVFVLLYNPIAQSNVPSRFSSVPDDGVNMVLWYDNYNESQLQIIARTLLKRLGARHISVPAFASQPDKFSSHLEFSEEKLAYSIRQIKTIQSLGMTASFLPLAWGGSDRTWRGLFQPTDVHTWFQNYSKWILRLAEESQKLNLSWLIVGTEMSSLYKYTDEWKTLIARVRKVYAGPLVLTANFDDLNHRELFLAVDAIGISAYFPLSTKSKPNKGELEKTWKGVGDRLLNFSHKLGRPLHITELGYPSIETATQKPWEYNEKKKTDQKLQAQAFDAFRKTLAHAPEVVAVQIWGSIDQDSKTREKDFDVIDKPAEKVVRQLFKERADAAATAAASAANAAARSATKHR